MGHNFRTYLIRILLCLWSVCAIFGSTFCDKSLLQQSFDKTAPDSLLSDFSLRWHVKIIIYVPIPNSVHQINPLKPKDHYRGRTAPLTSKRCILCIYSTNICTEYFKHVLYSPFFSSSKCSFFIILTYLVPVLFTFYIQGVLKLKKK